MTRIHTWTVAAATALMLAGCAPSGPVDWDDELDLGVPGTVIDTVEDVEFYPACGNEVLTLEGETWYPFTPANPGDFPSTPAALASAPLGFARASAVIPMTALPTVALATVVAPGPGDATGTLTRFEGGFAWWEADSGDLETWLTTTEIEYQWVC